MCQRHFFNNVAGLSLSQVFSYFTEHLWATASTIKLKVPENCSNSNNQKVPSPLRSMKAPLKSMAIVNKINLKVGTMTLLKKELGPTITI